MNEQFKRFPEDFQELKRNLTDVDVLMGINSATGEQVFLLASRIVSLILSSNGLGQMFTNAISGEATARTQAISTAVTNLKNDLLGGASAAFDTFKELQTLLENDAELTTTLVTGLANEITARQNAINTLALDITNEFTNRQDADAELQQAIADEATNRGTAIASESTARTLAITTAVNNLKNDLLGGASSAFDTFKELQTLLEDDAQLTTTILNLLSSKANIGNVGSIGFFAFPSNQEFDELVSYEYVHPGTYGIFINDGLFGEQNMTLEVGYASNDGNGGDGDQDWYEKITLQSGAVYRRIGKHITNGFLWGEWKTPSGGLDPAILLKINQAYNFAQQSCLTDDNGEILTEENGDVIIDL